MRRVLLLGVVGAALVPAAVAGGATVSRGQHDPGSALRWSPDGAWLVFARGNRTFVMDADGARLRSFVSPNGDWSPDGRHFGFRRAGSIYVAEADGSRPRRVAKGDSFAWAPGSDRLVIANGGLWVVRADGTGLSRLTTPPPCGGCYGRTHEYPTWAPDGRWIAYSEATGTDGLHGFAHVHVVRPDGTGDRAIESDASIGTFPRWSPDARWLLYTDDAGDRGGPALFVAQADAEFATHRLGAGSSGIWSPTSRALVSQPEGAQDLYVSRPSGGTVRIRSASGPSWSPRGDRLAFQRGSNVVVARPDGTAAHTVARGTSPAYSRTGVVAYVSNGCGAGQGIHLLLPGGRDRRVTTACTITGDDGRDTIDAGPEPQSVLAGVGSDVVHGAGGDDFLDGGPGDDAVYGDRDDDIVVGGRGVDRLFGGPGRDVIRARDGWRDAITCGAGRDTVEGDAVDLIAADCELVRRR